MSFFVLETKDIAIKPKIIRHSNLSELKLSAPIDVSYQNLSAPRFINVLVNSAEKKKMGIQPRFN